jgi:hypothetical protein
METGSGPIDDLLSHDLHAAAAPGRAEFWILPSGRSACQTRGFLLSAKIVKEREFFRGYNPETAQVQCH